MPGQVIQDAVIPASHGAAFEVKKGQVLRIYQVERKQVADCTFFNAHDHREVFHVGQTWLLNVNLGTGPARRYKHLYSKPPRENVMLTVLEDSVGNNWGNCGARCSTRLYEMHYKITGHRSCQENLTEALQPYGLSGIDIGDIFNAFMNVELGPEGEFAIKACTAEKDDHIDLLAEMDILAAISACPSDVSPTNDFRPRPLGVQVFG